MDQTGAISNVRCDRYVTNNVSLPSLRASTPWETSEPAVSGSLGSSLVIFKNIDLSFLTTWSIGGKVYDGLYSGTMNVQYAGNNWHKNVLRR